MRLKFSVEAAPLVLLCFKYYKIICVKKMTLLLLALALGDLDWIIQFIHTPSLIFIVEANLGNCGTSSKVVDIRSE